MPGSAIVAAIGTSTSVQPAPTWSRTGRGRRSSGPAWTGTSATRTTGPRLSTRGARRGPGRRTATRPSSTTTSVHVVVVVIGDAFRARVQVPVLAERGEPAAHPVRDRRARRRPAQRRSPRTGSVAAALARLGAASARRRSRRSGARSVLLITSRSARAMPGPPLRGMSSPPATSITNDLHVGEGGREDRGQVVAAALDEHEVERAGRRLELARPPRGWRRCRRGSRCAGSRRSGRR